MEGGDAPSRCRAWRPGEPAEQLAAFELKLVDMLCAQATPETARDVADKTWDLVHDRRDEDPVKRRVVECHEALARLSATRRRAPASSALPSVRELPGLFDLRVKARSIAYLFATGATLGLLTLVFPHADEVRDVPLIILAAIAYVIGAAVLRSSPTACTSGTSTRCSWPAR